MKPGKLPHDLLAEMLSRLPQADARVLIGPRVGEDAAVVDLGDRLLVATTDPITFATDLIGWYAVHINANDVAVMGAEPRWFLATLLLPPSADKADIGPIFDQISEACREVGAAPIGGHTEITIGIDRPIMVATMLGEVARDKLLTSAGAREGDVVILTQGIAIEGTAILAREAAEKLRGHGISEDSLTGARRLLFEPGISVVAAARAAAGVPGVTAMHDPTEGGIATGLRELAVASEVGLEIRREDIPVLPLTHEVCAALELDPLGLIASGSLLATCNAASAEALFAELRALGIEAAVIGRVVPAAEGMWLQSAGKRELLPEFPRDEVARFLEGDGG
ncbi:MAG: AIR synthase family protein [Armatimonadetes bacterium]|nr:AIR synthase family protein [Armatimonadota bacterium]